VFHVHATDVRHRGSKFLKNWMDFLEENSDLRYPNLADVYVDDR
jgi:DNA polymerase alpha-associated DNA helicase A